SDAADTLNRSLHPGPPLAQRMREGSSTAGDSMSHSQAIDHPSSPPLLARLQRWAIGVGVVGSVLCVIGALLDPTQFFQSYLAAYLFWLGLTLGSLALLMLQTLMGGAWSALIRHILEA